MGKLLEEKVEDLTPKETPKNRPQYRVVQTGTDRDGKTTFNNVGGIWENKSKDGKVYYTMLIGQLRLLIFPNEKKGK